MLGFLEDFRVVGGDALQFDKELVGRYAEAGPQKKSVQWLTLKKKNFLVLNFLNHFLTVKPLVEGLNCQTLNKRLLKVCIL